MKYIKVIYAILIIGIIVTWIIFFMHGRDNKKYEAIPRTDVVVKNKIINVGETPHYKPVEGDFQIVNKGPNPLIISDITTDCNCTTSDWDNKPIPPSHVTSIRLVYNGSTPGYFQKKAFVTCNVVNSPIILILRGNVENSLK
jgi:hypothetical protein